MEDSRRMILGFLLIFIIMLLFQFYAGSRNKNAEPEETTEQITTEDTLEKEIIKEKENLTGLFAEKEKNEEKEEEDSAEVFKVSTKSMDVYLSSKGGVIDSVYLKDYKVTFFAIDRNEPLLSTSIITSRKTVSTEPIDFKARVEDKNSEKRVIFSYMLDSVEMKKIYTFPDSSYLINVECSPQAEYLYDIGVFDTGEEFSRESYYSGAVYYAGGKSYTVKKGDLFKGSNEDVSGAIQWVGYKTKYFLSGVVPEDYLEDFILEKSPDQPRVSVRAESYARLYFGPLKFSVLSSVKEGLENAIYFGLPIIRPIAKFIYNFMVFLHKYIDNYGLVIIVFVICLVLVLSPLTLHQTKSMGKMKELQPKMQEIRKKYKNDPQRMNQETMKLYRETGFNPFSSCLPMFLQMPIFFALFQVLNGSIELKGAPFLFWIKDLSQKDPYYILPILTGISMFLQQRVMSPANQDDQQKIMSYLMPVFITFIFLTLPSGLTLYFFTYNILMLGVQTFIQKRT
ncbi:MAG: membrane protein insertase YidC [candidate division WOR-3 bacterium]